jgi:serine protease inhibitor
MPALAMTANGADGDTLAQMEKLLGGSMPMDTKTVHLDRPFVYAITDNATSLQVFIEALMTL